MAAGAYWASPHFLAHLKRRVLILTYHRVIPRSELATTFVQPGMYVTPETFECHLRFLTRHFTLLSFEDLLARWQGDAWEPARRYCTITFDDGWLDNYVHAYPLLRAYRAPATIFLPTDLIGTDEWLWSDRIGHALHGRCVPDAIDSLIERVKHLPDETRQKLLQSIEQTSPLPGPRTRRFVNWNEVREMSTHGIAFGSHTCTHAALGRLDREPLQQELRRSLDVLRMQGVNYTPVLSYPYGDSSATVAAESRAAGYLAAVTGRPGLESSRPADLFRLKRIGVHDDVSRSKPLLAFHIARHAGGTRSVR